MPKSYEPRDRELELIERVIRNTNRLFKSWNKTLRRKRAKEQ